MTLPGESPAQRAIETALRPGEKVLWAGGPDASKLLNRKDAFAIPFSLLWGGFSFYWLYSVIAMGAPIFFILFGVPFALLGVYFIVGRFVVKTRIKRRTRYAVTDQRSIIAMGSRTLRDHAVKGQSLTTTVNGSGSHADVAFSPSSGGLFSMWENTGMDAIFRFGNTFAFYDVPEPQPMLDALHRASS